MRLNKIQMWPLVVSLFPRRNDTHKTNPTLPSALSNDSEASSKKVPWKASTKLQLRSSSSPKTIWYRVASMALRWLALGSFPARQERGARSPELLVGLWIAQTLTTKSRAALLLGARARLTNQSCASAHSSTCCGNQVKVGVHADPVRRRWHFILSTHASCLFRARGSAGVKSNAHMARTVRPCSLNVPTCYCKLQLCVIL